MMLVDPDLDLIRIDSVAHSVAAAAMDDIHVDPLRPVDLAGEADDHLRLWLLHGL